MTTGRHIIVKICGLSREDDIKAAVEAGADYVGFVFFPPSPRNLPLSRAERLAGLTGSARKTALTVNAGDKEFERIIAAVGPDLLQLHGRETPRRAAEIRKKFGLPVMKSVGIRGRGDLEAAVGYAGFVDRFLIDARPGPDSRLPGGNGVAFDWRVLEEWRPPAPWMLAGGLNAGNVREALDVTGARQVDVSSGVETAPGKKSPERIAAFVRAARGGGHVQ